LVSVNLKDATRGPPVAAEAQMLLDYSVT